MSNSFDCTDVCVLVMARAPLRGQVKSRLAAGIGEHSALRVHKLLLEHTLETVRAFTEDYELHIAGPVNRALMGSFATQIRSQRIGNLGDRMAAAFLSALRDRVSLKGMQGKQSDPPSISNGKVGALMVGSDCAALSLDELGQAATAIREGADVVLGPSHDGGYYLIGLKRPDRRIFDGIDWGTSSVLRKTVANAKKLGCRTHLLPLLSDVDYRKDLSELGDTWNTWWQV